MRTLLACLLVAGCASDPIDSAATIDRGIYGQLTITSDVAGQPDAPATDFAIAVYPMTGSQTALATQTSDRQGFYQFELAEGSYEVCTDGVTPASILDQWQHNCAGKCTYIAVATARLRADWGANLSGGLWDAGNDCPR